MKFQVRISLHFHYFPLPMEIYDWFSQTISSFAHCACNTHTYTYTDTHILCTHRIFMVVMEKEWNDFLFPPPSFIINHCSFYFWNLLCKRSGFFYILSKHRTIMWYLEDFNRKIYSELCSSWKECNCSRNNKKMHCKMNMLIFLWIIYCILFRILLIKFIN